MEIFEIYLKSEKQELIEFLKRENLDYEDDINYSIVAKEDGKIIASASLADNVIKGVAISKEYRNQGLSNQLISKIIDRASEQEIFDLSIFTKPENINLFTSLGFDLLEKTKDVALLDNNIAAFNKYLEKLKSLNMRNAAALVLNCNPFTLGHRYLIEKASRENEQVIIFVVQEDKSLFSFKERFYLIKEGTKDLKNIHYLSSGKYLISNSTFPTYFIKDKAKANSIYTQLDCTIFAKYIARALDIKKRYVGTESTDLVTKDYNQSMKDIFKKYDIELIEVQRLQNDSKDISASNVRKIIKESKDKSDFKPLKNLLPLVTYNYLISDEADPVIKRIKDAS